MNFVKKYKHLCLHTSLFAILIILDQFSKYSALNFLTQANENSFLGLSLQPPIKNYNLIFGFQLGLDPLFISTSLTALFCLFLFYYILSLVFFSKSLPYLQIGITVLFSGFASNAFNKMISSYNLDFIKWSLPNQLSIYLNLADIFQSLAFLWIFIQIFSLRKFLYRSNEKRTQLLILKKYQLQFIAYCILTFFCLSTFFLLINYQFLGLVVVDFTDFSKIQEMNSSFLKYSFFILFLIGLLITLFFLYLSNKIYGPIYAFERYTRSLMKGEKPKDLKFRKNDQLKHLEHLAKDIKKEWDQIKKNP